MIYFIIMLGLCLSSYFFGAAIATYYSLKEFEKRNKSAQELLNRAHKIMNEQTKVVTVLYEELNKMKSVRPTFRKVETNENNNPYPNA